MKRLILGLLMVVSARADLSQTATFSDGMYLSLDTGQTGQSAGAGTFDIQWSGGAILPVGKAKIANTGVRTAAQFDLITETDIKNHLLLGGVASIPAANIVAGDIFECITNFGNASKIFVVRAGGGTIMVNFLTYQAAPPGAPKLTTTLNNSSLIADGLPNSGIAPSSLFIIRGTGMADPANLVLQSSADPGLPLTLNGASITVTVGGVTTQPAIYYTSPTQIAAVMPANTPVGTGTLTVTHNGLTSAPLTIHVVKAAPGINVFGTNSGVATDALTGAVLTFLNSGSPGQILVLWMTGLGANPSDSDTTFTSTPHAVNANLQVFIGGVAANILYAGSSGYPGVNQVNVAIPDGTIEGCWVPVAAVIDDVVSNIATLPIHKGSGECVDAVAGLKGSQLMPGGTATFRAGFVGVGLSNTFDKNNNRVIQYASTADFSKYSGISYDPANSVEQAGCIIVQAQGMIPGIVGLDAGEITITGPGGLNAVMQNTLGITGAYNLSVPPIPQNGGTYTWTGAGGNAVGSFTSTVNLSPLFAWTNPDAAATISKGAGLKVTWTGGNPGSLVEISGASDMVANGANLSVNYRCFEHVEAGQFSVPTYILKALPNGQAASTQVTNVINFPLSASGLDIASGLATVEYSVRTTLNP